MENLTQPTPKPPISPARLAANRSNARKSTGPRTPAGKARAASNSLQHGLYSLAQFENFLGDNNLALSIADNLLAEHQPLTPTEHFLVHQLIHCQLRFLQMQDLYKKSLASGGLSSLDSTKHLPLILRELDRLPGRMLRTLKALQEEKDNRDENTEIEAIPDLPPIPDLPSQATPSHETQSDETKPISGIGPAIAHGNRIFRLLIDRLNEDYFKPTEADLPITLPKIE